MSSVFFSVVKRSARAVRFNTQITSRCICFDNMAIMYMNGTMTPIGNSMAALANHDGKAPLALPSKPPTIKSIK